MTKVIVSVSKKNNSVWRIYYYDIDEDNNWNFYTKRINPLLVWFYKLKKCKLYSNICDECDNEFKFYKDRFSSISSICANCDDEIYSIPN